MLQARDFACILLFAASACWVPATVAQDDAKPAPAREFQRLGDQPVDEELDLELNVQKPEEPAVKPETPQERKARQERERQQALQRLLQSAREAESAGRIDQPSGDCAWFYYRKALDLDPSDATAMAGLQNVQEVMIERAMTYAKELDFETADRLLDDAALAWNDPERIGLPLVRTLEALADPAKKGW